MFQYSKKVMEHFTNPRNVGEIEDADGTGTVGNPVCGDLMTFFIKVQDDRLVDIKFKTFGCGAAIAVSSIVSEMAKGKTIKEAMSITNKMVANELGGLPKNKLHCSNLGADALHNAIEDYRKKKTGLPKERKEVLAEKHSDVQKDGELKSTCKCPYCESTLQEETPFCQSCSKKLVVCKKCGKLTATADVSCSHCNAAL